MKLAILSDLHLGYRQYGSLDREEDFYTQYLECMRQIKEEEVNGVIIAGDIFDKPNPSPKAMNIYRQGILSLNGIPVYTITGNHTMLMRKNHYTVDNYFSESGIENYHLIDDDIYITNDFDILGLIYRADSDLEDFYQKQEELLENQEADFHILLIHQAIKEYCGFDGAELSINDLNTEKFDLIICGHIHSPYYTNLNSSTYFLQPGSIERMNKTEASDEISKGKGFFIYDLDEGSVEFHTVSSSRKFLMGDIDFNSVEDIDKHFQQLQDEINQLDVRPIVSYNYYDMSKSSVYIREKNKELDGVLINNSNVFPMEEEEVIIDVEDMPTVIEAIDTKLKDYNDKERQLAKDIFNAYDKGNEKSVGGIIDNFFTKHYKRKYTNSKEAEYMKKEIQEYEEFFNNLGGN